MVRQPPIKPASNNPGGNKRYYRLAVVQRVTYSKRQLNDFRGDVLRCDFQFVLHGKTDVPDSIGPDFFLHPFNLRCLFGALYLGALDVSQVEPYARIFGGRNCRAGIFPDNFFPVLVAKYGDSDRDTPDQVFQSS